MADPRDADTFAIGERIRELRKKRGLTLQEVGERVGLSSSYLSQIENTRANVTLETLQAIAHELGVHLVDLFSGEETVSGSVVRAAERRSYNLKDGGTEQLLFGALRTALQVAVITLLPGGAYPLPDSHPGDEFTYVLSGRLKIFLGDTLTYDLDSEDIVYYRSSVPHRWENIGPDPVTFLVANTPASF